MFGPRALQTLIDPVWPEYGSFSLSLFRSPSPSRSFPVSLIQLSAHGLCDCKLVSVKFSRGFKFRWRF